MQPEKFGGQGMEVRQALKGQKRDFVHAAGFSVMIGLLMLSPSFYMLEVYGRVVDSRSGMTLAMLTLLLGLAYAALELLQWIRHRVLRRAAEGFDRTLAKRVYEAVFQANLQGEREPGLRGLKDFAAIRDFIGGNVMSGLMDIPMALLLIGVIFWIHPALGWFCFVSALIQGGIAFLNKQATASELLKANALSGQAQGFVRAALANNEAVEAMGMTQNLQQRWLKLQRALLRHQALASDGAGVYSTLSRYVQLITSSMMLGLGSWLVLSGDFTQGAGLMLMASILAGRALAPLVQVIVGWRTIAGSRESFARLETLLEKIAAPAQALPLPAPLGVLRVEQATVHAPGTAMPVLHGVSLAMQPGRMLAVIGPSASGKSCLAHALVGVWPCVSGSVRLDGMDVFAWAKHELGPHVGFLPQNVALFEGTIAENIARFGQPDMEKIEQAARQTGLHELILALPQAYATEIGVEGETLSGGIRQRIALARALYGSPRLVVLDEPDANLDTAGEAALLNALKALCASGATVVVMTHRMRVLAAADLLLLLMDGRVQLFGPGNEVIAKLNQQTTAATPGAESTSATNLATSR
ncbi:MAG: type I secretion system permease/ATPase [Zoogloeaceae bacterium]|jgi:ATP-binding cassette subfamily C exporter for protease/lipase|nr:type I secretion system permease/ATPase [Zoogloeaceae bacterium]